MITFSQAQEIVWDTALKRKLGTQVIPLSQIDGRICAGAVQATHDIQPFDNSAMDGFAVRRSDLLKASEQTPIRLHRTACIAAGNDVECVVVKEGCCVQIMTGGVLPEGADAVVPVEKVRQDEEEVYFVEAPIANANIRRAGEDFKSGKLLLKKGDRLSTAHILPLASLGIGQVTVFKKARVAFLSTGEELVDDLSAELTMGQIYNSNRPYGTAKLTDMGANVVRALTLKDDKEDFLSHLQSLSEEGLDIIISSGAVSAGEFDFVKAGLQAFGAEILYHKVKIRPGKPNLLARFPNGSLYFGLPGNPVATAVGLRFFVDLALRAMTGQDPEIPAHAVASNRFTKKAGFQMFLKGQTCSGAMASTGVEILEKQASFMVSPFIGMDCWVVADEASTMLEVGESLDIYPL